MSLFHRNKNNNKPVIRQVIDLVPPHLLRSSVMKYQTDKYCHMYKAYDQLVENITIANLSCGGCVNTITKKLTAIAGVEKVEVDLETNNVLVNHNATVSIEQLTQMLLSIGYPEATVKNGLLTKLKSVTGCITGKLSN